jgi:cytochrome P450
MPASGHQPTDEGLDLLSHEFLVNPYPTYAEMRDKNPALWDEATGSWYVTRYQDVHRLLKDPRLISPSIGIRMRELLAGERVAVEPIVRFFDQWMVFSEDPETLQVRKALQHAFSPSNIGLLALEIDRLAAEAVTALTSAPQDLITCLAQPFSLSVMGLLLGVENCERDQISLWSSGLMEFLDRVNKDTVTSEDFADTVRIIRDLSEYVTTTVLPRGSGLLSVELQSMSGRLGVTPGTVASTFAHILTGGLDPVPTTIGVALVALCSSASLRSALRAGEISCSDVVEEALRIDSPFHFASRLATADIDICGTMIRRGESVALGLASANRDGSQFSDPDQFNPGMHHGHLAFGLGRHYCLGAFLARTETTALLHSLDTLATEFLNADLLSPKAPVFGATKFQRISIFV